MWIDKQYYEELLKTLTSFSKGDYDFDENVLNSLTKDRYTDITEALKEIRDFSNRKTIKSKDSCLENIDEITTVLTAVTKGDLTKKITVDVDGDFLELKNTINSMIDAFSEFVSEITKVSREVGIDGKLGGQIKVDNVSGIWLDLTNNINNMSSNLKKQVDNLDYVTNAFFKGDLTKKITVDANGDLLEVKNTINNMIDEFSEFVSEITKVSRAVGNNGKFGIKANLETTTGVWRDLTNNINQMSESLARFDKNNKEQNWIKDGISILSKKILYKDIVADQFQLAISQLCRYANIDMGAIYIYDSMTNKLYLEACYAYDKESHSNRKLNLKEGIVGQVAFDREAILINSNKDSGRIIQGGTVNYQISSTYTAPLIFKGKLLGVVELASHSSFNDLQIKFLENALNFLSGSFYASIQARDNKKLEYISKTDALTGLNNRGYFDKVIPEIIKTEKRTDGLISFAILDIDHFKRFNDNFGHTMGDKVLQAVGKVLKENLKREEDFSFRIGGEEFAIIFSALNKEKAFKFANKLKDTIGSLEVNGERVTISIGLVCKRATEIKDFETLFKEADSLLYEAKNSGRNKVIQNN